MRSPTSIFTVPISFGSQHLQQLVPSPSTTTSTAASILTEEPEDNLRGRNPTQQSVSTRLADNSTPSATHTLHSIWKYEHWTRSPASLCSPFTVAGEGEVADSSHTQSSTPKRKRALPTDSQVVASRDKAQPSRKKRRLSSGVRHNLDLSASKSVPGETGPSSPLFFSRTPQRRPLLPARFSSSEAGAAMLMHTTEPDRRVMDAGVSSSGAYQDANASTRSSISLSDTSDRENNSHTMDTFGQIGIVEFLEHDERPTFVIDLDDPATIVSGTIHVLFANAALRSRPTLLNEISAGSRQGSIWHSDFQSWMVKSVKDHHGRDLSIPTFRRGEFLWTCSTLRKRFRLVSGTYSFASAQSNATPLIDGRCTFSTHEHNPRRRRSSTQNLELLDNQSGYHGGAAIISAPTVVNGIGDTDGTSKSILDGDTEVSERSERHVSNDSSSSTSLPYQTRAAAPRNSKPAVTQSPQTSVNPVCLDWTQLPVSSSLPPHIQFVRSVDWASTDLGPIEHWSPTLRAMSNLVMASPHPAAMYWGVENTAIYNEAYVQLAGQKHPALMGCSYQMAWSEIWPLVKDVFANARKTGQATMKNDDCLFLRRSGFLEETYFSWSIVPLVDGNGQVVGLYNPAFELTRRKIAERRMLTLREIGERTATAREVKDFWGQVLQGLQYNEYDTPFVLLYSVAEDVDSDDSLTQPEQCFLEGALGVPKGHQAAPGQIDLRSGSEGFGSVFREAMNIDNPVLLETENGTLPPDLISGIDCRGFGDPCRAAVVCSIQPTTGDSMLGFLVMGINPRRPYDDDYSLFVQLLSRQLGTSLASVVLFEEEIQRGQRAAKMAALDRIELSEQLAARTQEAVESETRFTRMAELSPVGMIIADPTGRINYCNETWCKLSGRTREDSNTDDWIDLVTEQDQILVHNLWATLLEKQVPMTVEFRFKTPWEDRNGNKGETWVLASAYPEKDQDGVLKSVFGSVTDISQQKWAEDFQKRKMEEAVEMKRQQENFIDITSHEMRNPLSAILQCADGISTSLVDFRSRHSDKLPSGLLDSNIDAAQTIVLCAQHQKRIVDDILTFSKLDSALLLVTPVDIQPIKVVQRALKMFEGEMATAAIKTTFHVDESVGKLNVDWVKADPSRLLQVLINLTTNAIKFTTTQAERTITVTLSVSVQRPARNETCGVSYFPTRSKRENFTEGQDWGHGQKVFIHFAVRDTGPGLNESEKKLLFQRFSQVSPRTHVQYGGSGLGLFISRELVELQGGEIGVSSERGKGSTFAFYVEARKSTAPPDSIEQSTTLKSRYSGRSQTTRSIALRNSTKQDHIKVLIVEDNLVNQRVLQQQLRNEGYTVYVANHGEEALDRLKQSTYWRGHEKDGKSISVILMDVEMPVMDGLTCARRVRELQECGKLVRHVPIIAVTANARVEQIDTALEAGMVGLPVLLTSSVESAKYRAKQDNVVSKPFRISELMPKIEELVARYQKDSSGKDSAESVQT